VRRALAVALLAIGCTLALALPAHAHALVRSSDPPNGAELGRPPARVVITFTELPDPKLSFIHVLNAGGQEVTSGSSGPVPGNPLQLQAPLKASLPSGVYTITWRTVSRVDGHVTGGSLSFGVGVTPPSGGGTTTSTPSTPSPPPLSVAGRWMFYWGLAVLVGAVGVGLFVSFPLAPGWRPLLGAAWVVAAGGLVAMILSEASTVGVSVPHLFGTSTGHQFLARGIAVGLVGTMAVAVALRPARGTLAALGVATAGAMLIHVMAGHAGASGRLEWFNVAVQWVHVLAVGIWIGGLIWLLLGLRTLPAPGRGAMVRRFSWMAGWALALVAVTGLSRALDEVGWPDHWNRLFDTSFGITVLVKMGLFSGLVTLGAINRYRNVPRADAANPGTRHLRLAVGAEVALASLILAATGVMSELPPSASVAAAATSPKPPAQVVLTGSDFATTVRVRLAIAPGMVGPNRFSATVEDFDTGAAAPARSVALTFSLPSQPNLGTPTVPLQHQRSGMWTAQATTLSMYGTWNVEVLVQEANGSVTVPLHLTPRLPPEIISVSSAAGQPTLYTITLPRQDSLQTYVDPGKAGKNVVHFTFFQASGNELPISSATAMSIPPGGSVQPMPLIRFDRGHFAANTSLSAGRWRFVIEAATAQGASFTAYFDQTIPTSKDRP
jgi:copper transport protein